MRDRPVECHLGDAYGDPLPPLRPLIWPPAKPGWIERGVHLIIGWLAAAIFCVLVIGYVVILFMFFTVKPARSQAVQYPVAIPAECAEFAQRAGIPSLIENRRQGLLAKAKLYAARKSDPVVAQCREAVERLKAERK